MNFTNGVKNKCERISQGRNMLLQFAGSFPLCSRKAASPLLTREARRPGRKGAPRTKTGLPPAMCKQHLIIKLKKHTNEIKTFSKWAAALRPDFMGPWPVNLYLCLNWTPGKGRFWCQQEGREGCGEQHPSLSYLLSWGVAHLWTQFVSLFRPLPCGREPSLGSISPLGYSLTHSLTQSHQHTD